MYPITTNEAAPTAPPEPLVVATSTLPPAVGHHHHVLQFQMAAAAPLPWSTGLFDCSDDIDNCCMTCFCPCITFGQIAEIIDHGSISCCASSGVYAAIMCLTGGCQWVYSCFYRRKLRGQLMLEESPCPCGDCCVHCCCEPCALCQEYRQLRMCGLDPYFGWHGNILMHTAAITR